MTVTRPGAVIGGRYRLDEALGRGGFGVVWRARDLELGLAVAVKEVRLPESASAREYAERLQRARREARNAAALRDHPHIVAVHDLVTEGNRPWMVMRLVDGESLEHRLDARGPLPVAQTERMARALLSALGAAHEAGIVHRDVKPANVMTTRDGEILLADFGIAVHAADSRLTSTDSVIGTLEYLAPERLRGMDRPCSDLFSLGATLYEAVEGVSPFRRLDRPATVTAVLTEQPPTPSHAGRLAEPIMALLEKDPAVRPTVAEALSLLDAPANRRPRQPTDRPRASRSTAKAGPPPSRATAKAGPPPPTDAARKRAAERGVDLAIVQGTGPGGRITIQDVYKAESSGVAQWSGIETCAMAGILLIIVVALVGFIVYVSRGG